MPHALRMSRVVYALFESAQVADEACEAAGRLQASQPLAIHVHRDHIDELSLPERATEVGRNNLIAAGAGGGIGLVMGLVGGTLVHIPGLNAVSAGGIGMITGVLVGYMSAIMSGAREPVAELRELAPRLSGRALLTVDAPDDDCAAALEELLEERGASDVGSV